MLVLPRAVYADVRCPLLRKEFLQPHSRPGLLELAHPRLLAEPAKDVNEIPFHPVESRSFRIAALVNF